MFCLSIFYLMNAWVVSTYWLLWMRLLYTSAYKLVHGHIFPVFLGVHSGVELWNSSSLCNFWSDRLFQGNCSIVLSHYPCAMVQFFHILSSICSSSLFVIWLKRFLSGLLICISLLTFGGECLFMCILTICISSLAKCLFKYFGHFSIGLFVFL